MGVGPDLVVFVVEGVMVVAGRLAGGSSLTGLDGCVCVVVVESWRGRGSEAGEREGGRAGWKCIPNKHALRVCTSWFALLARWHTQVNEVTPTTRPPIR